MRASFDVRVEGDVTIVGVRGRLTLGDPVDGLLRAVSVCPSEKVILNLGELDYVDSSGLGELISLNKQNSVRLVAVPKRVEDLLRLTGNYSLFDVQPDEPAALRSFL